MKEKFSSFSLLLFMVVSPYVVFTYFYIPYLIQENGNGAFLIPIFLLLLGVILILLLPKCIGQRNYYELIKKSHIAKYALVLYLALSVLINLFIATRVIAELFFYEYHYIFFAVLLIAVTIFLSKYSIYQIINSTTILFLAGFLLGIMPYFLTNKVKNYSFLLPISSLNISSSILFGLYFVLDFLAIGLLLSKSKKTIKRKHLVFIYITIMLFFTLEITHIIVLAGSNYFNQMEFLGLLTFFIQDAITYIGNLGFIYLYLIPIIAIFKSSLELQMLYDTLKIKPNLLSSIIISLIVLLTIIFIYKTNIFLLIKICILILSGLLFLVNLFIMINRSEKYEAIF